MKSILTGLLMGLLLTSCTIVGPGERGVRYNFGSVSEEALNPGTHVWMPYFFGAQSIDVTITALEMVTSSGTKDQQEVTTSVVVNVQVNPEKVVEVIKRFGSVDGLASAIRPMVHESISAKVSKYSAEEILTKREQLKKDIEDELKNSFTKYPLLIHDVSIRNLEYSKEYAQAIEQKQIAEQKAKQAEYDTQKITQEAKSAVAHAEGQAKATVLKAEAEAKANRLKQATITKDLIQYEAVQKWNGELPQVNGSGVMPMLNLGGSSTK